MFANILSIFGDFLINGQVFIAVYGQILQGQSSHLVTLHERGTLIFRSDYISELQKANFL